MYISASVSSDLKALYKSVIIIIIIIIITVQIYREQIFSAPNLGLKYEIHAKYAGGG